MTKAFTLEAFLIPHLCFACRLSFKRVHKIAGLVLCPNCKRPARMMARKFQAPPRQNIGNWKAVELLYQNGWRGHGWNVSPQMTLREARDYLAQKPLRERAAQIAVKQETQNAKWQAAQKRAAHLLRHRSSTR